MIWRDRALASKEDFAEAMMAIQSQGEADQFKQIFALAFPDQTDPLLGYLVGDCTKEHQPRVFALLGVQHPCDGQEEHPLVLGFNMHKQNPELAKLIMEIPRKRWLIRSV